MSRIKSKDTAPELIVRKFLFSKGLRYKLHVKSLSGKPDIVLPKYKTVIFVHGCFFHGHANCRYFVIPKTRTDWWMSKINSNQRRDEKAIQILTELGWQVLTIFECELKPTFKEKSLNVLLERTIANLGNP